MLAIIICTAAFSSRKIADENGDLTRANEQSQLVGRNSPKLLFGGLDGLCSSSLSVTSYFNGNTQKTEKNNKEELLRHAKTVISSSMGMWRLGRAFKLGLRLQVGIFSDRGHGLEGLLEGRRH